VKRVMVVGGAGYVGSVLVGKLLEAGHEVVVYDIMFFGSEGLPRHPALTVIRGDVRDTEEYARSVRGCTDVIHLACISNDPSFELNPTLGKEINFDSFEPLVVASKSAGVSRFIYASSSSVYGVSDAPEVTEEHPLVPLTDYSKYKALTEPLLLKHQSKEFTTVVIRPATVCGYSKRMRLDLAVNILTNHAVNNRRIKVFGGSQKRPNIHIDDITELYVRLLDVPAEQIAGQTFNAGFENHTLALLAKAVKDTVERTLPAVGAIEIETTSTDDLRSYHVSSAKLARVLGFVPSRSIEDAVRDMCQAFASGLLPESFDNPNYFNVKKIKALEHT
jgi:nucleoside-diphosphate-sugar epimerase